MAYFAPYIDENGLHLPTYQDILNYFISNAKSIFGDDIYLDTDSADYQLISIQALAYSDAMQSLQLEYNNRAPSTAIGVALDSLVKINGIKRKISSYSSVILSLTGKPNTTIENCAAADTSGNKWNLPTSVTFDDSGNATAQAVCQVKGAIVAPANTVNIISTPAFGWFSVNNESISSVGLPVETDSKLRFRQTFSTELASDTLLDGTKAAVAAVENVSRSEVYENDNDEVDANGIPGHSICAVVEGGSDSDIAKAIFENKNPGCNTYGSTTVSVLDTSNYHSYDISFDRVNYVNVFATFGITTLTDWNDGYLPLIKAAVVDYLNNLNIGQKSTRLTGLVSAALSVIPDMKKPPFAIQSVVQGILVGAQTANDITIPFNSVATSDISKITVNKI